MSETDDDIARLRVPPHSVEAEHSVLGSLLLDGSAWDRVADAVSEADFYRHEHRLIFAAIAALVRAGKPADVITVFERLQELGNAENAGGLVYLNQLAQSVPSAANARCYAEIVREHALLRAAIAAADELATAAFSPQGRSVAEVIEAAQAKLSALATREIRKVPRRLGDVAIGRMDHFNALADGKVTPGWPLGLPNIDRILGGGLRPGGLYILAARPKVGKSSLALRIASKLAADGLPALILSQEMPDTEVADREISRVGAVDFGHMRSGQLDGDDWGRLAEGVDRIRALPLYIDDEPALTLAAMRAKARLVPGLRLLVVDYLQLSSGSGTRKDETRSAELEGITRGLKAFAKSEGVAVLALSQLNREVEKRANKRPVLSDLRDSGAIEQDADAVLMLWPHQAPEHGPRLVGCAIEAQRNGPTGVQVLQFDGAYQRWGESTVTLSGGYDDHPGGFN